MADTRPDWTGTPPRQAWRDTISAAYYAALDDAARCCVTIAESTCNPGWLVIAGVHLLASAIRDGVPADELRGEVLGLAAQTGAPGYTVSASIEAVLMAEALAAGDLNLICRDSQMGALDLAHCACALFGQVVASMAADPEGVFDRLRHYYGIGGET